MATSGYCPPPPSQGQAAGLTPLEELILIWRGYLPQRTFEASEISAILGGVLTTRQVFNLQRETCRKLSKHPKWNLLRQERDAA